MEPEDRNNKKQNTGVSFYDFKKALGPTANNLTDLEIEHIRVICDKVADAFFDKWLRDKNVHLSNSLIDQNSLTIKKQ
ncbi:MAG: hypothetical protein JWP09_952 [Candidatus Taylorbacteria bacterium]|nr:hypothetical protein [Candidatus Taylorbacteria bacterium]